LRLLIVEIYVLCVFNCVSVGLLHCIQEPVWVYCKGGDGAQQRWGRRGGWVSLIWRLSKWLWHCML